MKEKYVKSKSLKEYFEKNSCEKKSLDYIQKNIKKSWEFILAEESEKKYYQNILKALESEIYYPDPSFIFHCLTYFDITNTKVIILGQDPYHGKNQAMGLSFSVNKNMQVPPSLKNIYKEINRSLGLKIPKHGYLEKWAEQGVLLLNSSLTVKPGIPGSHQKLGWHILTDKIIKTVSEQVENCVFMLWGNFAKKKVTLIEKNKHLILTSVHPSPFSARRGFIGNDNFTKCNEYLRNNNKKEIDWSIED